jgi:hypothetical protein
MPELPRPERVVPPLREYSFAQCPDAKLAACCQYEYLRSSELIREAVARARAGETDPRAKAAALLFGPDIFWAFQDDKSWPGIPYLDADEARKLTPASSTQKQKRRNLAHLVKPWAQPWACSLGSRHIVVYIPPGQSLPRLKKAIGDYLQKEYPELLAHEPPDPQWDPPKRGRGSLIEQTRADLTGLSTWRLRKKFRFTVDAAILLMRGSTKDKSAFYRTVRRADQKINLLEEQLGQMAKRVAL